LKQLPSNPHQLKPTSLHDSRGGSLLDTIGGMSAGEEFYYSKDELLEMLKSYLLQA
jgi:hypothetical protein